MSKHLFVIIVKTSSNGIPFSTWAWHKYKRSVIFLSSEFLLPNAEGTTNFLSLSLLSLLVLSAAALGSVLGGCHPHLPAEYPGKIGVVCIAHHLGDLPDGQLRVKEDLLGRIQSGQGNVLQD